VENGTWREYNVGNLGIAASFLRLTALARDVSTFKIVRRLRAHLLPSDGWYHSNL